MKAAYGSVDGDTALLRHFAERLIRPEAPKCRWLTPAAPIEEVYSGPEQGTKATRDQEHPCVGPSLHFSHSGLVVVPINGGVAPAEPFCWRFPAERWSLRLFYAGFHRVRRK